MLQLPDEIILDILTCLPPWELTQLQLTCRRLLALGRDAGIWKTVCFDSSRAEASRRRRDLLAQQNTLAELRLALRALPTPWNPTDDEPPETVLQPDNRPSQQPDQRTRALANWDPTAPGERIDWYEEYVHRHGPVSVGWLETPVDGVGHSSQLREALGMGALYDHCSATTVVSPLDDGSICIWDVNAASSSTSTGRIGSILTRSKPSTLNIPTNLEEETGAIDNVSVDSTSRRAYIAIGTHLTEVDLTTLQVTSRQKFPFSITAVSRAEFPTPLTVGTVHTLHQYDPRIPLSAIDSSNTLSSSPVEHIAGARPSAHATLSQPGPLSILHPPDTSSIWIAGRFTSLLQYDRRFWPRLASTTFSGARLSALSHLPCPFTPPAASGLARLTTGTSILAAGAYKGKGSLELYPLSPAVQPSDSARPPAVQPSDSARPPAVQEGYKNRQTASRARILAATPHGARILATDGEGGIKWLERDASSLVRATSLAQLEAAGCSFVYEDASAAQARRAVRASISSGSSGIDRRSQHEPEAAKAEAAGPQEDTRQRESEDDTDTDTDSGYASNPPPARSTAYIRARTIGERERAEQAEDVVQKAIPMHSLWPSSSSSNSPAQTYDSTAHADTSNSNTGVLVQTGEGRIGLLAFTRGDPLVPRWRGSEMLVDQDDEQDEDAREAWAAGREEARERRYDAAMRAALETQAREMWWVRGLGL